MGFFREKEMRGVHVSFISKFGKRQRKCTPKEPRSEDREMQIFHEVTRHLGPLQHNLLEVPGKEAGSYKLGEPLGRGAFGMVCLGYHNKSNQQVAIKVVNKRSQDWECMRKMNSEIRLLSHHSHHPNIISLIDVMHSESKVYVVMEKAEMDLDAALDRGLSPAQPDFFQQVASGVLQALTYLHERGVAHGDVHPGNVLICRKDAAQKVASEDIRLCDFGYSRVSSFYDDAAGKPLLEDQSSVIVRSQIVYRDYKAPEQWDSFPYDARLCDIWAVGCMLLELTLGLPEGWKVTQLSRQTALQAAKACLAGLSRHLLLPNNEEDSLFLDFLVNHLLVMNPCQRTTSVEALQHPFLKHHQTDTIAH